MRMKVIVTSVSTGVGTTQHTSTSSTGDRGDANSVSYRYE